MHYYRHGTLLLTQINDPVSSFLIPTLSIACLEDESKKKKKKYEEAQNKSIKESVLALTAWLDILYFASSSVLW